MKYKAQIKFKNESEWVWIGRYIHSDFKQKNIKDGYLLHSDIFKAYEFDEENDCKCSEYNLEWMEPVELMKYYCFMGDSIIITTIGRNPHKLMLGVEEFMVLNQEKINGI
jgi:hypothetical protein